MPTNGCKQILIPLLIAALFIVVMLAMGSESNQYSTPVEAFEPRGGASVRLEGSLGQITHHADFIEIALCGGERCIMARVPVRFAAILTSGRRVIVSGQWNGEFLAADRVLTRCHQE